MPYQVARPDSPPSCETKWGRRVPTRVIWSLAARTTWVAVGLLVSVLPSWRTVTVTVGPLSGSEGSGTAVAEGVGPGSAVGVGVPGTPPPPLAEGDGRGESGI